MALYQLIEPGISGNGRCGRAGCRLDHSKYVGEEGAVIRTLELLANRELCGISFILKCGAESCDVRVDELGRKQLVETLGHRQLGKLV